VDLVKIKNNGPSIQCERYAGWLTWNKRNAGSTATIELFPPNKLGLMWTLNRHKNRITPILVRHIN